MRALSDIRIVDLTRVLAGPYCTMLLADYGADVIKIEQPGLGDGTRHWGPPWIGDQSAYYLSINRNKRGITLNLKSADGLAILKQLIASADVLIENFKVGTLAKMGLDKETLAQLKPDLIVCSITGYGQTGPKKHNPGYDFMIQAEGGIMSITGPRDGLPHRVGIAITDITTGLFAANAILTALHHREKTGEGQTIDVALFDTQLAWLANRAHNYFASGETPTRYGNAHPNVVPYEVFATADGYIALAVGTDGQYKKFCMAAARPDLWEDERFQTNAGRIATIDQFLRPQLTDLFLQRTTQAWLDLLKEAGVPAGPINDIPTALRSPQAQARRMVQNVEHPTLGPIEQLGPVAKLSETPAEIRSAPPLMGQHTDEILKELGIDDEDIARLRAGGAF